MIQDVARRIFALMLACAAGVSGQAPSNADLLNRTAELQRLIAAGDWEKASALSQQVKAAVTEARNQSLAESGRQLSDSMLTWLPVDTETVVVATTPFAIPEANPTRVPSALQIAQGYVASLLGSAEKGVLVQTLRGTTIKLAMLGARRFGLESNMPAAHGTPMALGMIPYQACTLYAFTEPLPSSMIARAPEDIVAGHRVWISKGSQNDTPDRDTFLVSMLQPDLLAVCNNREFFQEMVLRIGSPQHSRALPVDLAEWKQVDRAAPLWGVSHYTAESVAPKMFFAGDPANDPHATGFVVEFGAGSGITRARMLATNDPWKLVSSSPDFHGAATSKKLADGVWELSVSEDPQAAPMAGFALMSLLGFIALI